MPTPNNKMNNQYEEARVWYDENWPCCIRLDIDWTCRGYDYPDYVVEWIKNDTTNWRKLNDENGGTYEYFARIDKKNATVKYDEARRWYDVNWPGNRLGKLSNWTGRILLDIDWSCRGYEYPDYIVDWIKNDTTNWRKLKDENGGTYEYFARMN